MKRALVCLALLALAACGRACGGTSAPVDDAGAGDAGDAAWRGHGPDGSCLLGVDGPRCVQDGAP
jgi:hypothetical protein